jgi:DNA (cytosine-5)-methyltransferase 1
MNFYNEFDPKAAAWLRELIKAGEIPEGEVDERSITEIKPGDLDGCTQCHFFAGIGGWPLALKLARWSTKRPVWTASLPCQPFSTAGMSKGVEDERHLWPVFFDLVKVCCPNIIFGEQVARAIGFNWLDGISADLEGAGYAVGQAVLGAHSVGSPHKRQRLYWLGVSNCDGRKSRKPLFETARYWRTPQSTSGLGVNLGDAKRSGLEGFSRDGNGGDEHGRLEENSVGSTAETGATSGMEHLQEQRRGEIVSDGSRSKEGTGNAQLDRSPDASEVVTDSLGLAHARHGERCAEQGNELRECDCGPREPSAWSNHDLIYCRDGKFRRVEAGTFPLAHGIPGRVGLLRGYGNAIVPQLAAEFIKASLETINEVAL